MDQLTFRLAKNTDIAFLYEASKLLQSPPLLSQEAYGDFLLSVLASDNLDRPKSDFWIVEQDQVPCGYILINYMTMMRYAGFCVEMEEVVILKRFQKMGIGRKFINHLITEYRKMPDCRQILVKTDDDNGSGKLYGSILTTTEMKTYKSFLNKV